MVLAFPCLGARALEGLPVAIPLERAQRAVARGDTRVARAVLDSILASRRVIRPGDVSLDVTVQEAWLRVAIGDTAAAVRQLDLVLNAFPTLDPWCVREEGRAAAIGRALLLRSELAGKLGDVGQRQRRAREALVLWQHADPSMTHTLDRLRVLASSAQ